MGDLYGIIGIRDMIVLVSMVVEFVLTLLLLLNILVSLMHTCIILMKNFLWKSEENCKIWNRSRCRKEKRIIMYRKRKSEALETLTSIQQKSPIGKLKIICHNDTHMAVQQRNNDFGLVILKHHPRVRLFGGFPYQFIKSHARPDDIAIAHKEYGSWRDTQT